MDGQQVSGVPKTTEPGALGRAKRSQHHSMYFVPINGWKLLVDLVMSPLPVGSGDGVLLAPLPLVTVPVLLLMGVEATEDMETDGPPEPVEDMDELARERLSLSKKNNNVKIVLT